MDLEELPDRRSVRLKGFDYSSPGGYFVTIVTHHRAMLFGRIMHGDVRLSRIGSAAEVCWQAIPTHFPHVELGAFVLMPNHVHGILILRPMPPHESGADDVASAPGRGTIHRAPTEQFGAPRIGSVPTIIRTYKAAVTRAVGRLAGHRRPIWQRNYYEHILRDEADWSRAHRYIESNPANWDADEENPAHTP